VVSKLRDGRRRRRSSAFPSSPLPAFFLSFFLALLRERVTSCLLVVFRALTLTLTTGAAAAVAHMWLAVQAA
jgi:hypothetical protein